MKHLFAPYEIAKQLKEKGFEEECLGGYLNTGELNITRVSFQSNVIGFCLAPLYQQIVDWLREKHKINITIENKYGQSGEDFCKFLGYGVGLECVDEKGKMSLRYLLSAQCINITNIEIMFKSYYEALDKAIEEALKLI